ncbi:Small ribosomal subunit protein mS47-like protein [Drosera capensis]
MVCVLPREKCRNDLKQRFSFCVGGGSCQCSPVKKAETTDAGAEESSLWCQFNPQIWDFLTAKNLLGSANPTHHHYHHDFQDLGRADSRAAILNRPLSLNSLNLPMVDRLKKLYQSWEENSDFGFVIMKVVFLLSSDDEELLELLEKWKTAKVSLGHCIILYSSWEHIFKSHEKEAAESHDEWCSSALKKLKEASPLSLKVTLESMRDSRFQPLDKCLSQEYRISLNCISKLASDVFCEGVRARLVDKDFAPKWDPPSLDDVSKDMVDSYFSPLGEFEPELELPVALRESKQFW